MGDTSLNVGDPDSTASNGVLAMVYIAYTLVGLTGPYYRALLGTSRPKRSRFCHIFLVQSLVWKYCLKLEGCLYNFFLIGPYSAAAEPNSAPKIVTQFLEPSLVL